MNFFHAVRWATILWAYALMTLAACTPAVSVVFPPNPPTEIAAETLPAATIEVVDSTLVSPAVEESQTNIALEPASADVEGLLDFPANVNPLTGLVIQDPSRLERRPVMVKVSNYPRTGRPHAGLSYADMVFEYYIGYGLNRFMAVYLGQDASQVGPVRSGRLVDAQLAEMYQGILFYGNADPQVDEVLTAELGDRALAEKFLPSPPKYRIGDVLDETTLFGNTAELSDYVTGSGRVSNDRRDLRGMIFSEMIHPENKPAQQVNVQFWTTTRGEWRYDPPTSKYLRWIEDINGNNEVEMIPLVDRLNNEQLAFSNVVILFATYAEYAPTLHDIHLYDNGDGKRALFFRDGVMIEGTWKSVSNGRPIQFFNNWGLPMHLKPGNTWIVLTGDSSIFNEVEPGIWELRFDLP